MLKLNLIVYDEKGERIDALSCENVAPQQIQALLMFLKAGWSFNVTCVNADVVPTKN